MFARRLHNGRVAAFLVLAGVNVCLLAGVVLALELIFGAWFSAYVPPYGAIVDRAFTYEQRLYAPNGLITYVRDQHGLRSTHGPVDQIEMITVGGSTTDQRLITEGQTWQDVIYAQTGIRVANAGVDGLSSSGHVVAVSDWLQRINKLRPAYYVHYLGVNDALYVHYLALDDQASKEKVRALRQKQIQEPSWSRIVRARSALVRSYLRLTGWMAGPPTIANEETLQPGTPTIAADADREPIGRYIKTIYEPNLRELIRLHRQNGERAVFVSQPANPSIVGRNGNIVLVRTADMALWAVALGMMNRAAETVCNDHPRDCRFIDLANKLPLEPGDFYDFVHATPAGARRIGTFLGAELSDIRRRWTADLRD